jgi:small subunit ribosomal protein S17
MAEETKKVAKKETKKVEKTKVKTTCEDRICPIHGGFKLKTRGRVFSGVVIKKLPKRITIEFERMLKLPKYERYEKRKTKIHARLPDCMEDEINVGDLVEVAETRTISKIIHAVVTKKIRGKSE